MAINIGSLRRTLSWALVVGVLIGIIGLFAFDGLPSVSAKSDTTAPTVSSVAITSDTDENDAVLGAYESGDPGRSSPSSAWASGVYRIGDDVELTVTFSENVTVTGSPQLELAIGSNNRTAEHDSTDGNAAVFNYTVAENDSDSDGIAVAASKLTLNGGSIKDAANNDATLSHSAMAAQATHKVDGIKPRFRSLSLMATSDGSDGFYQVDDELLVRVTFSEQVIVNGKPQLTLNIGDETRTATWERSGFGDFFTYEVQHGDQDSDGVSFGANAVDLNGGSIRDRAGNDAVLTHAADSASSAFLVDAVAPTVSSIAITSDPGDDDIYGAGDEIEVTVTFSEDVTVPGVNRSDGAGVRGPVLELNIGGSAETAAFKSYEGALVKFAYTVVAGDSDDNGISIGANKLKMNGGGIYDAAKNTPMGAGILLVDISLDAVMSHDPVADDSDHMVAEDIGAL